MAESSGGDDATADDRSAKGFAFTTRRDRADDLCLFSLGDRLRSSVVVEAVLADEPETGSAAELYRRIATEVRRLAATEPTPATVWPEVGKQEVDRGRELVSRLVARWSAIERLVFAMVLRHGCDTATTADAVGMPTEEVASTVARLRADLEQRLDVELSDDLVKVALPPLRVEPVETPPSTPAGRIISVVAVLLLAIGIALVLLGLAGLTLD